MILGADIADDVDPLDEIRGPSSMTKTRLTVRVDLSVEARLDLAERVALSDTPMA
jgi:hypothetical protein